MSSVDDNISRVKAIKKTLTDAEFLIVQLYISPHKNLLPKTSDQDAFVGKNKTKENLIV